MPEAVTLSVKEWSGKWLINDAYRPIATQLCTKFDNEIGHINTRTVLFLDDRESKAITKGRKTFAATGKVPAMWNETIEQLTGWNFSHFIVFYKKNMELMSREQVCALVYHELRHIGLEGDLKPHHIEDWVEMIEKLGVNWAVTRASIPDLLDDSVVDWNDIQGPLTLFPEQANLSLAK